MGCFFLFVCLLLEGFLHPIGVLAAPNGHLARGQPSIAISAPLIQSKATCLAREGGESCAGMRGCGGVGGGGSSVFTVH